MRLVPLLFLLLAILASQVSYSETLDEAVRALARKIAPRLAPGVPIRVAYRNFTSISAADAQQARVTMERALRRKITKHTPVCDVTVSLSENLRETLVVAEMVCGNDRDAAMVPFRRETPPNQVRRTIERRLLWEQEEQILDVAQMDGKLLVLDTTKLTIYVSDSGKWKPQATFPIEGPQPRDPRGRLEATAASITVYLPNQTCTASSALTCEATAATFAWDGEQARFTAGRNTLEANGWPPFYSLAHPDRYFVLAEADGAVRIYDAERRPIGRAEGWGSDLATACGNKILATPSAGKDGADNITLYGLASGKPVIESEPSEFPGPITALWATSGGATAIARNISTGRYAAYHLTIDCGR